MFAQQSVLLPAAKLSRLAHDGNQPMAPLHSSGAPCVWMYVCVAYLKKKKGESTKEMVEECQPNLRVLIME